MNAHMIAKYLFQKLLNRKIPLVNQSAELFCNINFPIWPLILVNFLIDVEVTRCNRNVVLKNVSENSIDRLCKIKKKEETSRKMEAKGIFLYLQRIRKGQLTFLALIIRKNGWQNVTLTWHIGGKMYWERKRRRTTLLSSLWEWITGECWEKSQKYERY